LESGVFVRLRITFEKLINQFLKKRELFQKHGQVDTEEESTEYSTIDVYRDIFVKIGEVTAKCFETCGSDLLKYLTDICSVYKTFLGDSAQAREQFISLYLFNTLVEYGGESALPVYQSWTPFVVQLISSPNPNLRRAAAMGIGLLSEHSQTFFPQILGNSISRLNATINEPSSRDKYFLAATQTAIATVGRIIQYHPNAIDLTQVLPIWLNYLPVTSITDATIIHQQLCHFFVQHTEILLGANCACLPRILQLFADVLGTPLVSQETFQNMVSILKKMQSDFPPELMQQSWVALNPIQQGVFTSALVCFHSLSFR
jgi:importin-5